MRRGKTTAEPHAFDDTVRPGASEKARIKPPSWMLFAMEGRAPWEWCASLMMSPILGNAQKGDGHPVLVFPGLVTGDFSTLVLRNYIGQLGYAAYAWEQGLNLGPRPGVLARCLEQIQRIHRRHRQPVSLIGWSLGGIYARELAKLLPNAVRSVITMGTPFAESPKATNAWQLYELASGQRVGSDMHFARLRETPPVPTTSIYSRSDGIVAWQCSVERETDRSESIEIHASHFGISVNPATLYAVADRLAQPHGAWKRFDRDGLPGLKRFVYRTLRDDSGGPA